MAGKFQMITDLYQQAVKEVTKSPDNWVSFLQSASRNYRLPFDEQILVHVQRPDATAVLQIEHWNRRFGRWVRKGSKGIAVLDQSAGEMALKYYFDISDTQESRNQSLVRPVPLWEVREEYREEVQETLANAFSADDGESLESTILQASRNIAEENMPDYLEDMLAERENSTLEELDEMNVRLKVRTILENSVAWMLLSRCGCDVQAYLTKEDFADIVDFDTPELTNILGTAASDLGELPLREIADTISKQLRYEKKRYRTFAFGSGGGYSVAIGGRKEENEDGRNRIQQPRGLSSSQSDRAGGTEGRWEVRITSQEVSEREPLRKIPESVYAGETEPAPVADTERRYAEDGDTYPADETGTGRDGTAQGREPDGVGRTDEQHPAGGRGNRAGGTDLQLKAFEPPLEEDSREEKTDKIEAEESAEDSGNGERFAAELPTVEEQMELTAEAGDEKSSAFSSFGGISQGVTQEDIDSFLVGGNGFADRKYRIYHQFGKQKEKKSNVEFLKREYGTGGTSHIYPDGTDGHVWYDGKGIAIEKKGSYANPDMLLSWSKVEKRLCELMRDNRYLTPSEKDHYADFLESISAPQYEIDTERKLARQRFIQEKAELPPAEKRDTLALRLADFIRDLDGYEKSLLENVGHSDLADVTADQMEQHLSDPVTEQDILDFLTLIQKKTTDTYIRSNAWRFSQELRELYPARYVYHEGSVVYIDAEQYEVSTINENAVSLRNVKFPLFGRDYSQDDFEKKLKENSANDYLITGMKVHEKTETPAEETPDSIAFSIEFSEHPAFYDRELNDRFTELNFALGNRLLGVLDEKQHYERQDRSKGIGWYKKTDFTIHAVIGGEEFNYEGRFDIGDGEGDLIAHIRNFYEYSLSNDCPLVSVWKQRGEDYYQKHMENLHLGQDVLLPFLEQNTELTPEDERLLAEIMATESDWHRNAEDKTQPGETTVIGEQLNIQEGIEKSDGESLPDFSISMIEDVLCFDEYMNHKRFDIQLFFQGHEEEQERIRYLKESYGGEYRHFDIDGKRVGYKAEENHLLVWEGNYLTRTAESRFSWREVQGQIAGMMERGVYYNRNPFGELPSEDEQLSLFDLGFDLQTESTGQGVPALQPEKPQRFSLPQQIIDEMLCLGGNEPGSVGRICANYMHSRTPEENIAFLKKEFGEDGKGFVSSQGKVSVWYQDDGIHLAKGNTALNARNHMVVSWEQADRRILELLQIGRYAPQEVLDGALPAEKQKLAETLWNIHHDTSEGTELLEELFHGGYPENTREIAEMMADSERLEYIIESLEQFALAYEEDSSLLRFHFYHPNELLERLKSLQREPVVFQAQGDFPQPELFISQDEVDALFTKRGSGVQHGKYRIYGYFLQERSEEENIAFLKEEYGTGGMGRIGYHEEHDAKGIVFSRGDFMKPYDKVTISWKQAAKRIKTMMRESRYLSEKEIAAIPAYEKSKLAEEIWKFFINQPLGVSCPYPIGAGYYAAESVILPQLEQTERVDWILEIMEQVLDNTAEFDRHYNFIQRAYHDLWAFREGDYTLFPNLPEWDARILANSRMGSVAELPQEQARENKGQETELPQEPLDEIEVLGDILSAIKIEDIFLDYEDGVLTARDEDNEWRGEEFYHFLLDEAIVLEEDGTSTLLAGEQLEDLYTLAGRYGIRTATPGLPAEEEKKAGMPAEKGDAHITPAWERKLPKASLVELHPEIPPAERNQYRITNDALGHGTSKEKFRANIAAIQLLKKCESENRLATPDEQEILAGYVGWGGLSDAFDETKTAWGTEYLELKTVLTSEEYAAARESTLTAFYTPPVVIRAMYQALENMGLKSANILEPSCGVGNFIGMKPESLSDCKIYGVEMDEISARIAGQLYQQSRIAASGYEDVAMPDSFFDVAVGNVPFGQFKVSDRRYDKNSFLIHDYFFAKTLDKVRPGGIIALITSYGTMDKKNGAVRKYIAERADLLGAIRLPNDAFEKNAGTKVTSDILFLQKRESLSVEEPDWVFLDTDGNGVPMNRYFTTHPEMILGEMAMESSRFGMDSTCKPREGVSLESQLAEAIQHIHAEIRDYETEELVEEDDQTIPANPEVENFSYTLVEGKIYYRENSRMKPMELSMTGQNRVRGMIAIRDSVRKLLVYQTEDYPDSDIKKEQENLNGLYDAFQKKYGLLNSRGNSMVFSEDNSYPLLCSLEVMGEDGTLERKADMFYKRTIKPNMPVNRVDTPEEALAVTLAERAEVDMGRMEELCGKSREEIEKELAGVIFRLPGAGENPAFVTADAYLSGNVREKLKAAKAACGDSEVYRTNVEALEKVQPEDLSATEIKVRLGTTWIPADDFQEFMYDLLQTTAFNKRFIKVHYSEITSQWSVEGKKRDRGNARAESTYGTNRANAYRIIEDSLNLRDTRVYDYIEDEEGRRKAVLNKKETAAAQGKQEAIRQAFEDWVWKDPERRGRLVGYYNEHFNAIRPREYDGSHLTFPGMNPEICLRTHQANAIARIIYGGNTLLAHVVGAGKTYTMVAAAMKMKQMGLCHKSMIVVPNHIIEQFAAEWLQLYPSANILVATKKSFEKKNRRKFCARIATGEYDAVIIGHSQFERIPMSLERQRMVLEQQKREVLAGIDEMKKMEGVRFTVKQLEKTRKNLDLKLEKLNKNDRKDDVITFEQLGVDRLFVDEADNYKNLFLFTKMRNVGGISQTDAQKSSDMFMKCRYLDELTGGKGVIFATGTPVSNSMVELYTMQRYLQYGLLEKNGLVHFDCWASMFGETVTAIELAPEGTGYRLKTRFARFHNIPEMMQMFKEVADIQTEDMLNLPVPKANYRVVQVKPSHIQKEMVEKLAERAERIRNGMVDPRVDNMLKITNEGRKLALDQRIINDLLPDETQSKVNACVKEIVSFWRQGKDKKLTQLVFSDLSTPKNDGSFNVYDDLREKLTEAGIPEEEIVFIHEADTDAKKKALFAKVRNGSVRVLIGSTFKMGAGTNVQDLIIASHDLDVPWRPRDLEQRRGRCIRQGNKNKEVDVIRYVTEGTFDAYMYQTIEKKQLFISQVMTSKNPARSMEDVDMTALSYAEIKALASGNPKIKEKMDLEVEVSKLQMLKQNFLSQKYELENKIQYGYPSKIKEMERRIVCYEQDIALEKENTPALRENFPVMQIWDMAYTEKKEAGKALVEACQCMKSPDEIQIGSYRGFSLGLSFESFSRQYELALGGSQRYMVTLGSDILGNITRIDNAIAGLPDKLEQCRMKLESAKVQFENAKKEAEETFSRFSKEEELREKSARLEELNALLEGEEMPLAETEQDGEEPEPAKKIQREMVR